jgi:hypothetical protein
MAVPQGEAIPPRKQAVNYCNQKSQIQMRVYCCKAAKSTNSSGRLAMPAEQFFIQAR